MHIGLDFDEVVTCDPDVWGKIIAVFHASGWTVSVVSIRSPSDPTNHEVVDFSKKYRVTAYFTHGQQKAPFMCHLGKPVDIWIDDFPACIPHPHEVKGTLVGCFKLGERIDPEEDIEDEVLINGHPYQAKQL